MHIRSKVSIKRALPLVATLGFCIALPQTTIAQTWWQKRAAAISTATNNTSCSILKPYYWEIGGKYNVFVSGEVNDYPNNADDPNDRTVRDDPTLVFHADTRTAIASATKWLYGAYVAERIGNEAYTSTDMAALNMTSGFSTFNNCSVPNKRTGIVKDCAPPIPLGQTTAAPIPEDVGYFAYGGNHFQQHGATRTYSQMIVDPNIPEPTSLVSRNNAGLTATFTRVLNFAPPNPELGLPGALGFGNPGLAGGAVTTAAGYRGFLQRMMRNELLISAYEYLGWNQSCAWNGPGCDATFPVTYTSIPPGNERPSYAWGHWVEDKEANKIVGVYEGDGIYASPGSLGFYPWMHPDKQLYGLISRNSSASGSTVKSIICGRKIRAAWLTGVAQ